MRFMTRVRKPTARRYAALRLIVVPQRPLPSPAVATEPAFWGIRRRALDALDRVHLARPAVRLYELTLAVASGLRAERKAADDGLPLPPATLRAQIGPRHADAYFFLRSGLEQAEIVRTLVREDGSAV